MSVQKAVLVIDDDPDLLEALQTVFEKRGYRVLTACDGNMGLAVAEREGPDLVVVDMLMPKQSGFRVLEKLKGRKEKSPHVIMMTANSGMRHRAYAELLGVDDFLHKPFAMDELLDSAERLCPLSAPGDREATP